MNKYTTSMINSTRIFGGIINYGKFIAAIE